MSRYLFGFILSISILISVNVYSAGNVTLASLDWEPYIGQNLENQGYVAELVREAFKAEGYTLKIVYLPWARVVSMAKKGEYDGYFPEYYSDSLKKDFFVSDPFQGGPLVFFERKGANITFNKLEDLKPFRIGVVRGYVNTEAFDNASYLKKDEVKDDFTNLKKLVAGRIDLMVADKFVGYHLIKTKMPQNKNKIDVVKPVLEEKDLYVCLSKKVKSGDQKLKAFNAGLKKIKENGLMNSILKKHGF